MLLHIQIFLFFILFFIPIVSSQEQIKQKMPQSHRYIEQSNEYMDLHKWDSAKSTINDIVQISEKTPTYYNLGVAELQQGIYSKKTKSYDESVRHLNKALNNFQKIKNDTLTSISLNHLGEVYRILNLKELSLKSYRSSLFHVLRTDNYRQQSFTLNNLANFFKKQQSLDSAKYYYNESIKLKNEHNISGKGKTLNNLAGVHYLSGEYFTARELYLSAIHEALKENDSSFLAYPLLELAVIDIENKKFDRAKTNLDKVSSLELDAKSELRFYEVMTYYFEENKAYQEALEWKGKYINFYKKYINEVQTKNIQDLSLLYDSERKDLEIDKQKLKIDVQNERIRLKNGQLLFLGTGVLVIIVVTYISIQAIRRRNKIETLQARFEGEKSIKTSIGKNLHDFIAPELHAARMKLELFQLKEPIMDMSPIIEQLQESTENIRSLSHQLSPIIYRLEHTKFSTIVQNALIEFERYAQIDIEMRTPFPEQLDALSQEDQENIYGIILEGLNNVRRHSKASKLIFYITQKGNETVITLLDDGVGIKEGKAAGIGIQNMKSRADLLKGTLTIEKLKIGSKLELVIKRNH